MLLNVNIEDTKLTLRIGKGYNDWVWLAHYAARAYSKGIYPQGTYIPTILTLSYDGQELKPHPR